MNPGSVSSPAELDDMVCECCRTDIAVSSEGPIAVYRDRTPEEIRDIYVARHVDGEWQPGERFSEDNWEIAGCPVNGPAIDARSSLVAVAWFTAANDHPRVQMRLSRDGGKTFGEPLRIATNNVAGQVDVVVIDDVSVAISWIHRAPKDDLASIMLRSVTVDGAMSRPDVIGRTADRRAVPQMKQVEDRLYFAWTDLSGDGTRLATARVTIITDDDEE